MSDKTHVITDAPKPKLRTRVKSKLAGLKPDKATTLVSVFTLISVSASYIGTRSALKDYTVALGHAAAEFREQNNVDKELSSSEED